MLSDDDIFSKGFEEVAAEFDKARVKLTQAIETIREGRQEIHGDAHYDRTKIALLHDCLQDLLDELPVCIKPEELARLEDAKDTLRSVLGRMVTS